MSIFGQHCNDLQLSGVNDNTITKINRRGWNNAVYANSWIESNTNKICIYQWTVKFVTGEKRINIGFITNQHHHDINKNIHAKHSYFYNMTSGKTIANNKWQDVIFKLKLGDSLTLILDLSKREIRGFPNNQTQSEKVLFRNIQKGHDIKYKLAATIRSKDTSIIVTFDNKRLETETKQQEYKEQKLSDDQILELVKRISKLKEDTKIKNAQYDSNISKLKNDIQSKNAQFQQKISSLETKNSQLQKNYNKKILDIQNDNQLKQMQLESLSVKMDKMMGIIQTLQQKMNEIENKTNNVELKMNDEEKNDNRIDKLMKKIEVMQQTLNQLSLNNNLNPKQRKLKLWLETECELPQYFDMFIQNGIDDLSVVCMLDKDALKDIGIEIIGHQIKILNLAKQLRLNNENKPPKEGGTDYM